MGTRTLIELNHDLHGVHVYGTGHSDDVRTRGFNDPHYNCHHKVTRID